MRKGSKAVIWLLAASLCLPLGLAEVPVWKVQAEGTGDSIITNDVLEKGDWKYKYEGTESVELQPEGIQKTRQVRTIQQPQTILLLQGRKTQISH